jgi:hypothetical protein
MAFPHHGYARATLDIDIFIEPTEENAGRVRAALAAFGFDVADVTAADLLQYKLLIRDYAVQLDVHPFVAGATFDEVWAGSLSSKIGNVPVRVPSLDDLIKMKEAAGRAKDLEDLRYLVALRNRTA